MGSAGSGIWRRCGRRCWIRECLTRLKLIRGARADDKDAQNWNSTGLGRKEYKPGDSSVWGVETRYIYQVLRGFAPEQVFAELLRFETVKNKHGR